jgi:hypothetical protein
MAIKRAGFGYRQVLKHDERGAGPFSLPPVLSIPNPIILAYLYKPDIHPKCDRCKFSLVDAGVIFLPGPISSRVSFFGLFRMWPICDALR